MNLSLVKPAPLPSFPSIHLENYPDQADQGFVVDSEDKAGWAADKYLAAQNRIESRHQLALAYHQKIDDWFQRASKEDEDTMAFMHLVLRPWVQKTLQLIKGKTKTLHILGARLSMRKGPDRVEVQDVPLAVDFCEVNCPEAVVIKRDISRSTIKQFLQEGKDIPGAILVPGVEELSIKEEE